MIQLTINAEHLGKPCQGRIQDLVFNGGWLIPGSATKLFVNLF